MKTILWVVNDIVLLNISLFLAQWVRYSTNISHSFFEISIHLAPFMTAIGILVFFSMGIYRRLWQHATADDLLRIAFSSFVLTVLTYIFSICANLFVKPTNYFLLHRMVYLLFFLMVTVLVGSSRLCYRVIKTKEFRLYNNRSSKEERRAMIIGASWAGARVVHEMQRGQYGAIKPVIIVDDDKSRTGANLSGVPVVKGTGNILRLVSDYKIDEIIIAISTPKSDLKPLFEKCLATGCRIRRINSLSEVGNDNSKVGNLRNFNITDLLGRDEEQLDMTRIADCFREQVVLITGGGGSIGSELCRILLPLKPKQIILFDINENYMYDLFTELRLTYGDELVKRIVLCVGSIRDAKRLKQVFEQYQPDIVLHAAAHKHVPLMEDSSIEAVKNNVFGTYNTAKVAKEHGVKRFVLISTDKAVNPTNVMGATKRVAEMIVLALNEKGKTKFCAVRFGNVLGSHGSVIPLFEQQIRAGGPITLTHPDIIRFFMTIPEAARLVLQAGGMAEGGEIFMLEMGRPVKIQELAERMIQLYGEPNGKPIEISYCGLRPGEKLYEELLLKDEYVVKTENDKIFIATSESENHPPLDQMLSEFEKVVEQQADARDTLRKFVTNYLDADMVNRNAKQR